MTACPVVPVQPLQEIAWPIREGTVTQAELLDDLKQLRMEVIRDNERKRQLKEKLDAINEHRR